MREPRVAERGLGRWRAFAAFRHPGYRLFWSGAFISNIGGWIQTVAQGWLVLELTDSAFMLGLVGFAGTIPMLGLMLLGGVFADRVERRRMLMWALTSMMTFAAVLAVLTWLEIVAIWHIIGLSLLTGSAMAMAGPAYQAFVHDLVGKRDLQSAIALNSAQFNLSRVVGPSFAGLIVGLIGLAGCFGVNALSFLAAISVLMVLKVASHPSANPAPLWDSLLEGLRYVKGHEIIQALLLLVAMVSILALPYGTLLPIIARDVLGLDASGLGYLFALGGTGAVVGALSLTLGGAFRRRGVYLMVCVAGTALATMGLGLSRTVPAAVVSLIPISFFATSTVALGNTLLQEIVEDSKRGRVLSIYGLAFMGTFPIGNLLGGSLAEFLSASMTLTITGAILLAGVAVVAVTRPGLRSLP